MCTIYIYTCLSYNANNDSNRQTTTGMYICTNKFKGCPLYFWTQTLHDTVLFLFLTINRSIYLFVYLSFFLSIYPSIHSAIHPSIHPSTHPSIHPSIYLSVCLSIYLSVLYHKFPHDVSGNYALVGFYVVFSHPSYHHYIHRKKPIIFRLVESQSNGCTSPFISWFVNPVTLWLFNIAMENGPFIDGLPIENGDFPWLC